MKKSVISILQLCKTNAEVKKYILTFKHGALLVLFFLMSNTACIYAQDQLDSSSYHAILINYSISSYTDSIQPSDFRTIFDTEEELMDFTRLRQYRVEKEELLAFLRNHSFKLNASEAYFATTADDSLAMQRLLTRMADNKMDSIDVNNLGADQQTIKNLMGLNQQVTDLYAPTKISKNDAKVAMDIIASKMQSFRVIANKSHRLNLNILNVKSDILNNNDALNNIYQMLSPQAKQQTFRRHISIVFSSLIALILIVFFFLIYFKSDNNIGKEILGSVGLQFITLFVLIIAVILFGILGVLQSSELAAILSGISGYILGKGIQNTPKNEAG